jgi:hypothetical protein
MRAVAKRGARRYVLSLDGAAEALASMMTDAESSSRLRLRELEAVEKHGTAYVGVKTGRSSVPVPLSVTVADFIVGRYALTTLAEEVVAARFDLDPATVHQKRFAKRKRPHKDTQKAPAPVQPPNA